MSVLRIPFEEMDNLTGEQLSTNALREVFTQPNVRLRRLSQLIRLHQLKQYVGWTYNSWTQVHRSQRKAGKHSTQLLLSSNQLNMIGINPRSWFGCSYWPAQLKRWVRYTWFSWRWEVSVSNQNIKIRFGWFEGGLTCLISHIFLYEYGIKNRVALSACGLPRTIWTRTTWCTAMFLTGWVKNSQKTHAKLCRVNQI